MNTRRSVPSRLTILRVLILKDIRELSRDKLWMLLAPMALVFFVAIYLLLPDGTESTIPVGVHPAYLAGLAGDETLGGLELIPFEDRSTLEDAVMGGAGDEDQRLFAGISFSQDLTPAEGSPAASVTIYLREGVPAHLRQALSAGALEAVMAIRAITAGRDPLSELPVTLPDLGSVVTSDGMSLAGFPLKQLLRPLMVMVILMMEALALASLVSLEIEHRTAAAVLVTPVRTGDLLTAKWLTGALMAVAQVMVFLLLTGMPWGSLPLLTVLVLLGAVMMSAVGMISGAAGKDFMGTLFLGMLFVTPMMIPALGILLPGGQTLLMSILPTSGLVRSLAAVMGSGAGWAEVLPGIGTLLVWDAVLFAIAYLLLRRRVVSL